MRDLIDRQAAIDALVAEARTVDSHYLESERIIHESDAVEVISMLPSAQSKTGRWIPCSERLPEEFGEYLVTKKAIGWNCEEYNSNDIAYFDNEGFHKADKVIAWMPLPEPWKGEEDGGTD